MISEERFNRTVLQLVKMIINARREAAYARALVIHGAPSLSAAILEQVRRDTDRDFDAVIQKLDRLPAVDALEFLRDFEGPIQ